MKMAEIIINTTGKEQIVDITDKLQVFAKDKTKVLDLFAMHTTCGLTTADLDPGGTDEDYLRALREMLPEIAYKHPHNPKHMPSHIWASLIGPELSVPVENAQLKLGTWQRIVLVELDGPRQRRVVVTAL